MTLFNSLENAYEYSSSQTIPVVFVILPIILVAVLLRIYLIRKHKKQRRK